MRLDATDPDDVREALGAASYIADQETAFTAYMADELRKPILVEGPPGSGKTELAKALARVADANLVRLQCYRGLDAENTIYEWNYMKQFLRIRAEGVAPESVDPEELEASIFTEPYLLERPLLEAIRNGEDTILLIDELDRAGEDFEAFLLEVLDEFQLSIPELGTVSATEEPLVIMTSNRTRKIGDALKRRALYLYMDHPSAEKEREILRRKVPDLDEHLAEEIVSFVQALRKESGLLREPGVAETLDWAATLTELGVATLSTDTVAASLSSLLKEPQDLERVDETQLEALLDNLGE